MQYKEIVAVTGLSGLYQLVTTKSDGAIVRNVADKTTRFIPARKHNVTPLESIEVYTVGDNVQLHHVFRLMNENEQAIPLADAKSANAAVIKTYFKTIFPEFDEDRVYVSDMKKMLKWYELLKSNNLLHFEEPADETAAGDSAAGETETAAEATEDAPAAAPAETTAPEPAGESAADEQPAGENTETAVEG